MYSPQKHHQHQVTTPPRYGGAPHGRTDHSPQFVLEDEEPYARTPQRPHDYAASYSSSASSMGPPTPQGPSPPALVHGGASPREYFPGDGGGGGGQAYYPAAKKAPSTPNFGGPQVPLQTHQTGSRHGPPPLTLQTHHAAPSPAFASPFAQAAPPSPVLAWNPVQRRTAGREEDMEKLVATPRSTMIGRDTGEERKSVFWNHFTMVAHKAEAEPKKSTWLRTHDGSVSKVRVVSWLALLAVCCVVGGLLAWHFVDP